VLESFALVCLPIDMKDVKNILWHSKELS